MGTDSLLSPAGPSPVGRLLVTPREAAKALSVCEKTLWSLAKRGEIPTVRIGRAVRYDVADLRSFVNGRKEASHG